jgi:F-type H+-transporting ATPase subunit delta
MAETQKSKPRVPSVLEDPSAQAVARVYADAFLNAAQSTNVDGAIEELASFLDDVMARNPEFAAVLSSGIVSRDDKVALIDRVIGPRGSALFTNFLRVLARHDRLDLLPYILAESRRQHEAAAGRKRVQVISARPLSAAALDRIRKRLAESVSFTPILETKIDPRLLGGVVIRINDTIYDSSLATRMKQLRARLQHRSLHEIQSGRNRFSHSEGN